jgi:TolB-like protein/DNA-binding winged helix-turn-helix (wHTH) protein/tetratricopeptide (TPR) repeat protein
MISHRQSPRLLRFGNFEIDPSNSELRKAGALVKLQAQHFQLLVLLAERAGQAVTREEIRQTLWGDQTFVDFDRSINFSINQIRGALDDDPHTPRYVETLPRRGYRFIAPVTESAVELTTVDAAPKPSVVSKPNPRTRKRLLLTVAAVALVVIALAVKIGAYRRTRDQPIESLAVLPLDNLSRDPEQEFFADGMTDELITDLAKISALRVVSRTSVMRYKGTTKPVSQVARELNVDAVLEGTVTRDKDRVRITAQLIRAEPEKHLWSEKYEGSVSEVLTLQDAVANAVAHEIQIKVTPQERARLTTPRGVNPEAYEAYLRGQYLNPTEENLKKMRDYFLQSTDKDPGYAPAWAGLAMTYGMMAPYGVLPPQDSEPRARVAVDRALQLDPDYVTAIALRGSVKTEAWDWTGAERDFKHAIELNPNSAVAHMAYSSFLAQVGRTREAVSEARRERELAVGEYWPNVQLAYRLYLDHQYEQAELESRKLLEWEPGIPWTYICQASVFLQTGRKQEAVAELRKAAALPTSGVYEQMYLGHALAVSGAPLEARKIVNQMESLRARRYVPASFIAVVYVGLDNRDRAFEWFERACAERSLHSWILPDPRLDQIRTEPRFKQLVRRMGLPQIKPTS